MSKPELARPEVVVVEPADQGPRFEELKKTLEKLDERPPLKLGEIVTYWVERYGKLHACPAMVVGGPWSPTCANLRVFLDGSNVGEAKLVKDGANVFTAKEIAWGSAWRTSVTLVAEPKAGFFTR